MNEEVKNKAKRLYNSLERFSGYDCESNPSWGCTDCVFCILDANHNTDCAFEVVKRGLKKFYGDKSWK